MTKHYIYKSVDYLTERAVRSAIFKSERKAFGRPRNATEWAALGVVFKETEPVVTEEQMARQVRFQRDRLLAACDYYVMPDYPSTEEGLVEVKAYRQALRDVTKQETFPTKVSWPKMPEALC